MSQSHIFTEEEIKSLQEEVRQLKQEKKAMEEEHQLFKELLAVIPDVISVHDEDLHILYSFANLFTHSPSPLAIFGEDSRIGVMGETNARLMGCLE